MYSVNPPYQGWASDPNQECAESVGQKDGPSHPVDSPLPLRLITWAWVTTESERVSKQPRRTTRAYRFIFSSSIELVGVFTHQFYTRTLD